MNNIWRLTLDTNPEDCNLKCIMCEEHSKFSDFKKDLKKISGKSRRVMPDEWLSDIFKEAKEIGVTEVIPSTMGEPLLYTHFDSIIRLCKENNIKMNLTTNGTFPKKSIKEWSRLLVPILSDVKVSLNGATAAVSEAIMEGSDFSNQISNLKEFIEYRNLYFAETGYYCSVTIQLTFLRNNMQELAEIIKLASDLGVDRIKGHHLWAHFNEIKNLAFKESSESINEWNECVDSALKAAQLYRKPNGEKITLVNIFPLSADGGELIPYEYDCPFLGKELWISATGKVSPCCAPDKLRDSLGDFGMYPNIGIKEISESKEYLDLVSNYKTRDLCKTCNMRQPKI
ncbi:MAG: radical SAM protein [Marinifilaceae bacterium]